MPRVDVIIAETTVAQGNAQSVKESAQLHLALPLLPQGGSRDTHGTQSWEVLILVLPPILRKTLLSGPTLSICKMGQGEGLTSQPFQFCHLSVHVNLAPEHSQLGSRPLSGAGSRGAGSVPAADNRFWEGGFYFIRLPSS